MKALLQNKYAVIMWFTRTFSRFGDAFESLAFMYIVYELTGSALAMGTVMIFSVVPNLLVSPFAGVIGDRYNKKYIMLIAESVRTVIVFILPLLHVLGILKLWHIYLLAVIVSIAESFFEPCAQVVMTLVVNKEQLPLYNSAITTSNQIARLIGFSLSGVVISKFNMDIVFVIDALTFLVSALAILFLKMPAMNMKTEQEKRGGVFEDIKQAIGYLRVTRIIPLLLIVLVVNGMLLTPVSEFLPIILNDLLKLDSSWAGIFLVMISIGNLLGSVIFPLLKKTRLQVNHLVLWGNGGIGILLIGIVFIPRAVTGLMVYIILGLIGSLITAWCSTEVQLVCDINFLTRIMSLFNMALIISEPLSGAIYGALTDGVSISIVFLINGVFFILSAVIIHLKLSKLITKNRNKFERNLDQQSVVANT